MPCTPHKERGVHCDGCAEFRQRAGRILLIKLGAAGDVIRTTPLLAPLRREYPDHLLTWVTDFPDLLPAVGGRSGAPGHRDRALAAPDAFRSGDQPGQGPPGLRPGRAKSRPTRRLGFTLGDDGICRPVTEGVTADMAAAAEAKFLTGLFDDVNQACTLSYPQEIFAICGYEFAGRGIRAGPAGPRARISTCPTARRWWV